MPSKTFMKCLESTSPILPKARLREHEIIAEMCLVEPRNLALVELVESVRKLTDSVKHPPVMLPNDSLEVRRLENMVRDVLTSLQLVTHYAELISYSELEDTKELKVLREKLNAYTEPEEPEEPEELKDLREKLTGSINNN